MWFLFPFCFALLVTVQGNAFREINTLIPKTDLCFIALIRCDDYKLPLLPPGKTDYEFFTDPKSLQLFCRSNEKFIKCTKDSIKICKAVPAAAASVKLMQTRGFAEVFCSPGSPWQNLYLENAECINLFSPAADDICTYKAYDLISANPTAEVRQFCRSSIAMRECFSRIIQKTCGIVAGDLLKRVVMFGTGDDFLCNELEDETAKFLQASWFSPTIRDPSISEQTARLFASDKIAPTLSKPTEIPPTDTTTQYESSTADEVTITTEMPQFEGYLEDERELATETDPSFEYSVTQVPYTIISNDTSSGPISDTPSSYRAEDTYSFKNFTSFGLYEILNGDDAFYLGCGTATVLWTSDLKLKNVLCGWVNAEATHALFECTIHLDEACLFNEKNKNSDIEEVNMDSGKTMLVVFKMEKENYREVATLKVKHFKPHRRLNL